MSLPSGSELPIGTDHTALSVYSLEMQVQSIGWEDPLENGMATHSNIPAWEILWTEDPGGLQSMGLPGVRQD